MLNLKGFSEMYDSATAALRKAEPTGEAPKAAATIEEQMLSVLEHVLTKAPVVPERPRRGRPPTLPLEQLWLALLMGILRQAKHVSTIWRWLCLQPTGSFAPVLIGYQGLRKRLLSAGTAPLQAFFERLSQALDAWGQQEPSSALSVAPFAREIVALDESTLDRLYRLSEELADVPDGDAHLLPGKLAGLFDLRRQRWMRLQFRADVLAACNTGVLMLLDGLAAGSLIIADLGYFSFAWFDYLTAAGYWWLSRLKEKTTYQIKEVLAYDDQTGLLDAIVWLGTYRADQAACPVRLLIFRWQGRQYRYLTNVLDQRQLSSGDIAYLYSRRWDIELAFKLLKCQLGLHLWWGARPEIVMIQLWLALILSQLLHALQMHVAWQAQVEPFDVSLPILVDLLPSLPVGPTSLVERLLEHGRFLGLIRPSSRHRVVVPTGSCSLPAPIPSSSHPRRHAHYAQRNPHPRKAPFLSHFLTQLLL